MAAGLINQTVGDGNGGTIKAKMLSDTGAAGGNLQPATVLYDTNGNPIDFTVPSPIYPLPTTPVSGALTTAMTDTADHSVLAAPGASLRNYITSITISNSHATVGTDVVLKDGAAGTVLGTYPAAALYGGCALALPTPLKQPTTNTAIYAANLTTGASVKVTLVGYSAA